MTMLGVFAVNLTAALAALGVSGRLTVADVRGSFADVCLAVSLSAGGALIIGS